jgi:uncharacterized protein (TIGR00251 family)
VKIHVQVKLRSKLEGVEELGEGRVVVKINVPPEDGKANERVHELLAKFYGISKSALVLVSGFKSKSKIFEVQA